MPQEQDYDDDEEEQDSFAYADYSGVVVMIQTYYYKTIELFRQYYLMMLKGKDHIALKKQIQSYIITVVQLMRNYDPIQKDKKVNNIFKKINQFVGTTEPMTFDKMKECINSIVDAHYILGLSKLEFKKNKRENHLENYKKDL